MLRQVKVIGQCLQKVLRCYDMQCIITDRWNKYLDKFSEDRKDIYYYEEYVGLYEGDGALPLCIVCEEDGRILLMPFLRGEIKEFYDFETPYGYGGPISNTGEEKWIGRALKEMKSCFLNHNYVCGFMRFHPLLCNADYCKNDINVLFDRNTVTIDTSVPEEEIWKKQIKSKSRNMVRKAEKNNLEFKAEYDYASLGEFLELYNDTMSRLKADDFYYFNEQYYKGYVGALKNRGFLGTIRKNGKLICGALFMYFGKYGHYHLEGSDREFSGLGANNLLLWKAAVEMHNMGVEKFHLGGGITSSQEDTLFKFKKAFSGSLTEFFIGKEIFSVPAYNVLVEDWKRLNTDKVQLYGKRLLCYRC